jgi:DNA-binding helix-hairpin-helix protein with protein kinase domain
MKGRLPAGTVLRTQQGADVRVEALIGIGGQGEVYRAASGGRDWALKWYLPELTIPRQFVIISGVVARGVRDPRFLWPRELVTGERGPEAGFGYLMDLRPAGYADLPALFRRDPAVGAVTPRTLLSVALCAVEAYRFLHRQGLAYQDISWGNLFFDPATGRVLICDNDNAVPDGSPSVVGGTTEFMAPELVRGDPGALPTTQTDLHALAVLLFLLLMNHHPLDGAAAHSVHCMDPVARLRLNGTDPVFIFDPARTTNRPVRGEQDSVVAAWQTMPGRLRALFTQAFTVGLRDPDQRVREIEWCAALREAHDCVVLCPVCRKQNILEPTPNAPAAGCWKCRRPIAPPPRLVITTGSRRRTSHTLRVTTETRVFGFHLHPDPEIHDFADDAAAVIPHPRTPGVFGLENHTNRKWTVHAEGSATPQEVPPGRRAALREGLLIEFGGGTEAVFHEH